MSFSGRNGVGGSRKKIFDKQRQPGRVDAGDVRGSRTGNGGLETILIVLLGLKLIVYFDHRIGRFEGANNWFHDGAGFPKTPVINCYSLWGGGTFGGGFKTTENFCGYENDDANNNEPADNGGEKLEGRAFNGRGRNRLRRLIGWWHDWVLLRGGKSTRKRRG